MTATPPQPLVASRIFESFDDYVTGLVALLPTQGAEVQPRVLAALDGGVSRCLRATIPLSVRRNEGAFFTGQALANRLVARDAVLLAKRPTTTDPACGAGDLLLAAAARIPTEGGVRNTLRVWGTRLTGRDLNPVYARAARARLALLAAHRTREPWNGSEQQLASLLPGIRVGDGTTLELEQADVLLLNPPFGATVAEREWGAGRLARAAVFTSDVVERLAPGCRVRLILPEVLRTGSNYRRWRTWLEERLVISAIEVAGQFDPWTDVDVFILRGRVAAAAGRRAPARWWEPPERAPSCTIGDHFEVRVGPVVPHRDSEDGPRFAYLQANDLPVDDVYAPGALRRGYSGRQFQPPLVAVRRTSRPGQAHGRALSTLIVGPEPVVVENHLLVCVPRDGTLRSCRRLMNSLAAPEATAWLDQRLRCRHLTTAALRDVPLAGWPLVDGSTAGAT